MRHAFKIPDAIKNAVKQHVRTAIDRVSPERYRQESPYTAALLNRLEGRVYDGPEGSVVFESTIVEDRGRNSAESEFGADFAITATISDTKVEIRKAILGQAKRAPDGRLPSFAYSDLSEQVHKMRRYTRNPKVLIFDEFNGTRIPRVVSGNIILTDRDTRGYSLESYFTARVLTTLDGDTRAEFVHAVQDSSLKRRA